MRRTLVLALLVAACGGTAADSTTTTAVPTTTTTAPTTTTTTRDTTSTTSARSEVGTRDNPVPVGESAQVGDFTVTVLDWTPEATSEVLDHNQFNAPPPDGSVFSLVRLHLEYGGADSALPWVSLSWMGIGASNVASEAGNCTTYPDNMIDVPEMFGGGAAEANICLTVAESDLDSLVLGVEELISFDETRVFFDLPR